VALMGKQKRRPELGFALLAAILRLRPCPDTSSSRHLFGECVSRLLFIIHVVHLIRGEWEWGESRSRGGKDMGRVTRRRRFSVDERDVTVQHLVTR